MKFEIVEDQRDQTFQFKGSFTQAELATLGFTALGRAMLNQPVSKETPMADHLLKLELIYRQYETDQRQKLKDQPAAKPKKKAGSKGKGKRNG